MTRIVGAIDRLPDALWATVIVFGSLGAIAAAGAIIANSTVAMMAAVR